MRNYIKKKSNKGLKKSRKRISNKRTKRSSYKKSKKRSHNKKSKRRSHNKRSKKRSYNKRSKKRSYNKKSKKRSYNKKSKKRSYNKKSKKRSTEKIKYNSKYKKLKTNLLNTSFQMGGGDNEPSETDDDGKIFMTNEQYQKAIKYLEHMDVIKEENEENKQKIKILEEEIDSLRQKETKKEEHLENVEQLNVTLSDRNTGLIQDKKDLNEKIEELDDKKRTLVENESKFAEKIKKLESEKMKLEGTNKELEIKINELKRDISYLQGQNYNKVGRKSDELDRSKGELLKYKIRYIIKLQELLPKKYNNKEEKLKAIEELRVQLEYIKDDRKLYTYFDCDCIPSYIDKNEFSKQIDSAKEEAEKLRELIESLLIKFEESTFEKDDLKDTLAFQPDQLTQKVQPDPPVIISKNKGCCKK